MRIVLAMILAALFSLAAQAEDWTVNGKVYHNVIVGQVEADRVHITYDGGIGAVMLSDLTPELQKRFNYDPQKAKAGADPNAAADAEARRKADDILTVKIGDTEIMLSRPAGMVDMPQDDPMTKAIEDLTPPDCLTLRKCISSDALDAAKASDPSSNIMILHTLAMKDYPMDIDSGSFIDFVEQVAFKASHGILESQDSVFDYVDAQKRLDQFQKDTGVAVQEEGNLYSLGMVSRSYGCVAYMEAEYVNMTFEGKTQREKCVSVVAYVRLKKKVLLVVTSLNKPLVLHDDLRVLMRTAEKYQLELQSLNNS